MSYLLSDEEKNESKRAYFADRFEQYHIMYTDNIGLRFVSETSQQSFTPLVLGIAGTGDEHILCTIIIIIII